MYSWAIFILENAVIISYPRNNFPPGIAKRSGCGKPFARGTGPGLGYWYVRTNLQRRRQEDKEVLADWNNTQVLLKYINCLQHLNDSDIAQAVSVATAPRSCFHRWAASWIWDKQFLTLKKTCCRSSSWLPLEGHCLANYSLLAHRRGVVEQPICSSCCFCLC